MGSVPPLDSQGRTLPHHSKFPQLVAGCFLPSHSARGGLVPAPVTPPPGRNWLLRLGIGRLVELALADGGAFLGRELVATLELDLLLLAFLDLRDADDTLLVGDAEQPRARATAADDRNIASAHADEFRLIGDEHDLFPHPRGKARNDRSVANGKLVLQVDVGNTLAPPIGPSVLISRRALSVAILGDGEDELLLL